MVGGVVIGVSRSGGTAHVHVADCPHHPKHGSGDQCPRPDTCCVRADETGLPSDRRIEVGDSFWWQCGSCYWTPRENVGKFGKPFDIQLPKIGYSH